MFLKTKRCLQLTGERLKLVKMFKVKMKAVVVLVAVVVAAATVVGQVREEEQEAIMSKTEPKNIDGKRH